MFCLVFWKVDSASKTGSFSVNSNVWRHLRGWFWFKVLIAITGQVLNYCSVFLVQFGSHLELGLWKIVWRSILNNHVNYEMWGTQIMAVNNNSYTGWGHALFLFRCLPTFRKKPLSPKLRFLARKLHGVRSQKIFSCYLQILFETLFNQHLPP